MSTIISVIREIKDYEIFNGVNNNGVRDICDIIRDLGMEYTQLLECVYNKVGKLEEVKFNNIDDFLKFNKNGLKVLLKGNSKDWNTQINYNFEYGIYECGLDIFFRFRVELEEGKYTSELLFDLVYLDEVEELFMENKEYRELL